MIDNIKINENIHPNSREIELLKADFPQFFDRDGEFCIDRFKKMLRSIDITLSKEGYELNFLGKSYARYLSSTKTETFISPDIAENAKEENKNSENLYIIGDNLDALKHLLGSYAGKIKCIYIDPPYNTDSDGFVYPDNFTFNVKELANTIGIEEEEAERIINLKGKSSHSAWLTFMYPRLILARELLSDDGVIFISIDDNEQANLKMACDEVFGEENKVGNLPTIMNLKGNQDEFAFAGTHEYTVVYAKNKESLEIKGLELDEEAINSDWMTDELGYYKKGASLISTGQNAPRDHRPNLWFSILYKDNKLSLRWILKIILFPISLVLSILTALLTFLLGIGTALLYIVMMFCIFGALASFIQLCPSLSVSSIEGALRKLIAEDEIKREGVGRATKYIRLK